MELVNQMKQTQPELEKQYVDNMVFIYDLNREVAKEMYKLYGTASLRVVQLGHEKKLNEKLHEDLPYLKSQVVYAIQQEMAEKPNDIVCRRLPIANTDRKLAEKVLPQVVEIMAKEKKWGGS